MIEFALHLLAEFVLFHLLKLAVITIELWSEHDLHFLPANQYFDKAMLIYFRPPARLAGKTTKNVLRYSPALGVPREEHSVFPPSRPIDPGSNFVAELAEGTARTARKYALVNIAARKEKAVKKENKREVVVLEAGSSVHVLVVVGTKFSAESSGHAHGA